MAQSGIRHEPPDIERIDWDGVKRELHNELVRRGLVSWHDVQVQQGTLLPAITNSIKRQLIPLYREKV
jgi:predicted nuclease with TOPRIM domain